MNLRIRWPRMVTALALVGLADPRRPSLNAEPHQEMELPRIEEPQSRPYLPSIGPSPLRFAPIIAPAEYRPVTVPTVATHTTDVIPAPLALEPARVAPAPTTPPPKSPPAILPDDTRPAVRIEDLIPYFLIPTTGDGGSTAPRPGTPPPSSATYRQQ